MPSSYILQDDFELKVLHPATTGYVPVVAYLATPLPWLFRLSGSDGDGFDSVVEAVSVADNAGHWETTGIEATAQRLIATAELGQVVSISSELNSIENSVIASAPKISQIEILSYFDPAKTVSITERAYYVQTASNSLKFGTQELQSQTISLSLYADAFKDAVATTLSPATLENASLGAIKPHIEQLLASTGRHGAPYGLSLIYTHSLIAPNSILTTPRINIPVNTTYIVIQAEGSNQFMSGGYSWGFFLYPSATSDDAVGNSFYSYCDAFNGRRQPPQRPIDPNSTTKGNYCIPIADEFRIDAAGYDRTFNGYYSRSFNPPHYAHPSYLHDGDFLNTFGACGNFIPTLGCAQISFDFGALRYQTNGVFKFYSLVIPN